MAFPRLRRWVRYAVGIGIAVAVHAPLFLKPGQRPARFDAKQAAELERDMKDVAKALAMLEQKAAEEAPRPPLEVKEVKEEVAKPAAAAPKPAPEAAAKAKGKDVEQEAKERGQSQPLTTPKMQEAKLPPKESPAPPPPPGSGAPEAPDAKRVTYKEPEHGKGKPQVGPAAHEPPGGGSPPPAAPPPAPPPPRAPAPDPVVASSEPRTLPPGPGDVAMPSRARPERPAVKPVETRPAPEPPQPLATHAAGTGTGTGTGRGGNPGETSDVGVEVPTIHFAPWSSRDEMIAVTSYFGMQLISYTEAHDFFVVVQLASNRFEVSKNIGWLKLFSNRMIAQDGPLFEDLRGKIGKDIGVAAERLTTGLVMPLKTANYLALKECAVCRKLGFQPADVESVTARFVRNPENGKWNLYIEALHLKGGRRIACGEAENRVGN